ncbi:MAG: DegT/DnrJ/EryC1/StrS family aminotransferase [Actinomycetota bacterium]|nr:DegT/DnrJ/EryC1/StrS family aminotransferase [Actinomycetota bacterium]
MVEPVIDIKYVQIGRDELQAVRDTLATADLSGNTEVVGLYEQELASWFDARFAVVCSSGTAAIHLALLALGVGPGAEVIVAATAPAMTALPVLAVGAVPVFADVAHPATFALDLADVAGKLTPHTQAVIAVPMWGYPADGPELARACRDWGVPLIEDAAQAHGTRLFGRYAGTQGMIGTFSTHARKLLCTGEGGFCITDDPALADRLRQLRNLGQSPGGGEFGVGFGLNYKLSALAAALGRVQLSRLTRRLAQRRRILDKLTTMASEIAGLEPFPIPHGTEPNGYAALFTAEPDLAALIAHRSRAAGIESDVLRYDYRPLYRTPVLVHYAPTQPCRNAERLVTTLLTVPCHERVATHELARIGAAWRG